MLVIIVDNGAVKFSIYLLHVSLLFFIYSADRSNPDEPIGIPP